MKMEANKSECEKCIKIAQIALNNKDKEKSIKFLNKALRLYPNEYAKGNSLLFLKYNFLISLILVK
jgi:hypothetical protein